MPPYTAIYLDRDGVISHNSPNKEVERDQVISTLIGREFHMTDQFRMDCFWKAWELPGLQPINTLEREDCFWHRWFEVILESHGIIDDINVHAAYLFERFCFYRSQALFPEVEGVIHTLHGRGYRLGVISDTFPSLEESIKRMGIASYFDSYTASSLVGAGKPDPRIFNAALQSLDVLAQESIFIDDCLEEADGAREQGFTSFHMDRTRTEPDFDRWEIGNLEHVLVWLDIQSKK